MDNEAMTSTEADAIDRFVLNLGVMVHIASTAIVEAA